MSATTPSPSPSSAASASDADGRFIITSPTTGDEWELVIGLEVHCELDTATKLFCSCPNEFGSEPNTNVCPVCLGLPGSLPVVNHQAVDYAMRLGRALHCRVEPSVFARKNYFYPDMPKDYQVTQFDQPTNLDGYIDLADGLRVGIERAHIEEDTGKNTHAGGGGRIHGADYSLVDYNRAGVPLVEIVSRPDLSTPDQAREYVAELRAVLLATQVSDAKMEEGSMRVDANVSVRRVGDPELGTRCEIKNLNSLRSLGRGIDYEARRQVDVLEAGESVRQETRHWDEDAGRTRPGRSKEEAEDYRYFQEPDLVPLRPDAEWLAAIEASLPLLPADRRVRLAAAAGVAPVAVAIHVERGLDDLALSALDALGAGGDALKVLNHLEHDVSPEGTGQLDAVGLAALVAMESAGELTATQAKTVLTAMVESGRAPSEIASELGFEAMGSSELEAAVDAVIAANPDDWAEFVGGDDKKRGKLTGFFVGQVMKATKGQADGKAVNEVLARRRSAG
jgi:aspartyl-tRNA(Asn)/glutamyl-tRNA(Gln) amidotransferase subunit B